MRWTTLAEIARGGGDFAATGVDARGYPLPPVVVVDLGAADWGDVPGAVERMRHLSGSIVLGWSDSPLPRESAPFLETLAVTIAPHGPGNYCVDSQESLDQVLDRITTAPAAALVLVQVLQVTARLEVVEALTVESMAYSTLLSGGRFRVWRGERQPRRVPDPTTPPVMIERVKDDLTITLARADRRNAMDRHMRDGLVDALDLAILDESVRSVVIKSAGPAFSSGGDLDEFGSASEAVAAHILRLQQSVGVRIHELGGRVTVMVHGACVGAGIELPAFASRVVARDDAWFQLPEVGMGLIPGAGGTVSIPRRIGRWRTAYLALTGERLSAERALSWGLVDEIR